MASIPESELVKTFEMLVHRLAKLEDSSSRQEQVGQRLTELASSQERRAILQEQRGVTVEDAVGEGFQMVFKNPIVGNHQVSSAEVSYYTIGDLPRTSTYPPATCASIAFQWSGTPDYTVPPDSTALADRARAVLQEHGLAQFMAGKTTLPTETEDSGMSFHLCIDEKRSPLLWWDQWAALALDVLQDFVPETIYVHLDHDRVDVLETQYFLTVHP